MKAILLDTHALAWTFAGEKRDRSWVDRIVIEADSVYVSPISIFEIGQKVRLGKWPEMEPFIDDLSEVVMERGGYFAPTGPQVCLAAALLDWDHRDPFDRLIAATAIENQIALVSIDAQFDMLSGQPGWIARIG